jgi:hypothetical protein
MARTSAVVSLSESLSDIQQPVSDGCSPITSTAGRLILCGVYAALAIVGFIVNRRHLTATLKAPFDDGARHDSRQTVEVITHPG